MKEQLQTITDLALMQAVETDGLRPAMSRPYNHENGFTYAINGMVLLSIPSSMCKEYEKLEGCRFPNVEKAMSDHLSSSVNTSKSLFLRDMEDLKSVKDDVEIHGVFIRNSNYSTIRDITAILGLEGWHIRLGDQYLILVNGDFVLLIMGLLESISHVTIPTSDEYCSQEQDISSALEYAQTLQVQQKLEYECDDISSCIYTFSIVRRASMYVKADSLEEAREIAEKHCGDIDEWDFDYPEVDYCEGGTEPPRSYMDSIFTSDGESTFDEVCKRIDDEIEKFRSLH